MRRSSPSKKRRTGSQETKHEKVPQSFEDHLSTRSQETNMAAGKKRNSPSPFRMLFLLQLAHLHYHQRALRLLLLQPTQLLQVCFHRLFPIILFCGRRQVELEPQPPALLSLHLLQEESMFSFSEVLCVYYHTLHRLFRCRLYWPQFCEIPQGNCGSSVISPLIHHLTC